MLEKKYMFDSPTPNEKYFNYKITFSILSQFCFIVRNEYLYNRKVIIYTGDLLSYSISFEIRLKLRF